MGDEPYAALLPWIVFAVVDRAQGGGPLWAGDRRARSPRARCSLTSSPRSTASRATSSCSARSCGSAASRSPARCTASDTGFLADDGRALSAAGFARHRIRIARVHARARVLHARPTSGRAVGTSPRSSASNVQITLIWAATFTAIALAHVVATVDRHARSLHGLQLGRADRTRRDRRAPFPHLLGRLQRRRRCSSATRSGISRSTSAPRRCTRPTAEVPRLPRLPSRRGRTRTAPRAGASGSCSSNWRAPRPR